MPDNTNRLMFAGTYHGVPGTYNCTPTSPAANCSAAVATGGFALGGGAWTFKATNPESLLMDMPNQDYASYGWWLHKAADDGAFTASAFHAYKGTDAGTVDITDLRGSATYMGGAAGKYALSSTTGGTNDAGHFTADAMLEAKFATAGHTISGTIDSFTGADGESRDWSVKLNETDISVTGVIDGTDADNDNAQVGTVWTIGETAGAASGEWSGALREQGDDGVPAIATGTFYSTYGLGGKMIGAFGANKQ